ncbi:unnamed protein product [Phytophthora lilii]|uniref:Unnamed protein product n=1 Tax=Phytophthora lilii TaxID=2077276 RepID=A0A9W6TD39_9STRA|nr:unnamed protein product [Phytophthora lilii]
MKDSASVPTEEAAARKLLKAAAEAVQATYPRSDTLLTREVGSTTVENRELEHEGKVNTAQHLVTRIKN